MLSLIAKPQFIRLIDVFIIGPYLLWLSKDYKDFNKQLLIFFGATTIGYNARNYYLNAKQGVYL